MAYDNLNLSFKYNKRKEGEEMEFDWQAILLALGVAAGGGVVVVKSAVFAFKKWGRGQLPAKKDGTTQLNAPQAEQSKLLRLIRRDAKKEAKKVGPKPNRAALPPKEEITDIPFMRLATEERFRRFTNAVKHVTEVVGKDNLCAMAIALDREMLLEVIRSGACTSEEADVVKEAFKLRNNADDTIAIAAELANAENPQVCYLALDCLGKRHPCNGRVIDAVINCANGTMVFPFDFDDAETNPCLIIEPNPDVIEEAGEAQGGQIAGTVKQPEEQQIDEGRDYTDLASEIIQFWKENHKDIFESYFMNTLPGG
jgi:hypothetical protein